MNDFHTIKEIRQQPSVWRHWADNPKLKHACDWAREFNDRDVWFCGAGTSAYIGDIIAAGLQGASHREFRSVPTTDIVSRPHAYLASADPIFVNFGRSGNSAETLGCLDAIDALLGPSAVRLNVTCNEQSALARRTGGPQDHTLILPPETHDVGFAMTSSFSTMVYSALTLFDMHTDAQSTLKQCADTLDQNWGNFETLCADVPERIVFLGSGALAFAAREAALKVLELTAGQIPSLWESTLGFRHGPKSFVTDNTTIVIFTSSDPHARKYEHDLIAEIKSQFPLCTLHSVGPEADIELPTVKNDAWAAPLVVAAAQLMAVSYSSQLGLNIDDPFVGRGTLSRVVSGVTLHEVTQ